MTEVDDFFLIEVTPHHISCVPFVHYLLCRLPPEVDVDVLAEVRLLNAAARARHHLRIIGEEVEALLGVDHQLAAVVALKKASSSVSACTQIT